MKRILSAEPGVDLVVFSGDQITGNNIDSNGTAYWAEAVGVVAGLGIPFFTIFGNHDDMPLQPDTARASGSRSLSITTRRQVCALLPFPGILCRCASVCLRAYIRRCACVSDSLYL